MYMSLHFTFFVPTTIALDLGIGLKTLRFITAIYIFLQTYFGHLPIVKSTNKIVIN